jgi:hypothetical protein|tara:strand:- start:862 stop:1179 length:318 start_codon:yes stop_codon:yes gene_type:complete
MVDVKITHSPDGSEIRVESPKTEQALLVYKPQDGFKFHKIKYEGGGPVPEEISGSYTGISGALKALLAHLEARKPTKQKAVNDRFKERKVKKEALDGTEPYSENG